MCKGCENTVQIIAEAQLAKGLTVILSKTHLVRPNGELSISPLFDVAVWRGYRDIFGVTILDPKRAAHKFNRIVDNYNKYQLVITD